MAQPVNASRGVRRIKHSSSAIHTGGARLPCTNGLFRGWHSNYVGSYGDGFNNIASPAVDPYGGDGARTAYGCGGCGSNNTVTPTSMASMIHSSTAIGTTSST